MEWLRNGILLVKRNLLVTKKMEKNMDLEKNGIGMENLYSKGILLMVMKK
jgi:hypothetical protein